jgi:hypothetical protein
MLDGRSVVRRKRSQDEAGSREKLGMASLAFIAILM